MKRNTTFLTDDQRLQLIDLLHVEACSCVIRNGDVTRIFRERGVKDLYRSKRSPNCWTALSSPTRWWVKARRR